MFSPIEHIVLKNFNNVKIQFFSSEDKRYYLKNKIVLNFTKDIFETKKDGNTLTVIHKECEKADNVDNIFYININGIKSFSSQKSRLKILDMPNVSELPVIKAEKKSAIRIDKLYCSTFKLESTGSSHVYFSDEILIKHAEFFCFDNSLISINRGYIQELDAFSNNKSNITMKENTYIYDLNGSQRNDCYLNANVINDVFNHCCQSSKAELRGSFYFSDSSHFIDENKNLLLDYTYFYDIKNIKKSNSIDLIQFKKDVESNKIKHVLTEAVFTHTRNQPKDKTAINNIGLTEYINGKKTKKSIIKKEDPFKKLKIILNKKYPTDFLNDGNRDYFIENIQKAISAKIKLSKSEEDSLEILCSSLRIKSSYNKKTFMISF